tara:strand:- start:44 stop:187 length:144 start_codon:yes stop_codon:yes gene_type:complete
MKEEVPYDILKIIAHRIIKGDILDGKDYQIFMKYKNIINLIIDKIKK